MDGLLFIEKSLEFAPGIKFIIVSGYDNFDYARQAVKLGVFDYILKPIDNNELKRALDTLKERIEAEQQRDGVLSLMRQNAEVNHYRRRSRHMARLAQGKAGADEARQAVAELDPALLEGSHVVCALVITGIGGREFRAEEAGMWKFAVANVFEECLNEGSTCITYFDENDRMEVTALVATRLEQDVLAGDVKLAMDKMHEVLDLDVYAGMSAPFGEMAGYGDALLEARRVVEQLAVFPKKHVLTRKDYDQVKNNDYILDDDKRRLIAYHMNFLNTNLEDLERVIDDIFENFEKKKVSYANMRTTCLSIIILILNEIKEKDSQLYYDIIDLNRNVDTFFEKLHTAAQYKEQILKLLRSIAMFSEKDELAGGRRIVAEIVHRIEAEYYMDIRLSALAAEYYINQSYLSTLFVKETGKKFSQYLTDVRLQKAREMLITTDFSVSRIAEFVGYKDRGYFTSVFQKAAGMSPAAYRRHEKDLTAAMEGGPSDEE